MEWYEPGPRVSRPRARSRPGTGRPGTSYFCHSCQSALRYLAEHGACPLCGGGFVEESPSEADEESSAVAEVVHWLAGEEGFGDNLAVGAALDPTEARIDRMLADLQAHLSLVEHALPSEAGGDGPHSKTSPAPRRLLEMIREVTFDGPVLQHMRQAAQCVVCCSDFEVGDSLSVLPGCGHLFHGPCVHEWLARQATCPICRCDLCEAAGVEVFTPSAPSSVALDGDSSQHESLDSFRGDDMTETGFLSWASLTIPASSRAFSEHFPPPARIPPGATVGLPVAAQPSAAMSPPPPPPQASPTPPPPRLGSSALVGVGSLITSGHRRPSSNVAVASPLPSPLTAAGPVLRSEGVQAYEERGDVTGRASFRGWGRLHEP